MRGECEVNAGTAPNGRGRGIFFGCSGFRLPARLCDLLGAASDVPRKPFPTWSPFLANGAEVHAGPAGPFAVFRQTGEHRNSVKPWREYDYNWSVYKITSPR